MPNNKKATVKSSPVISPITFIDELWRPQTIDPLRACVRSPTTGQLQPTRPAPAFAMDMPNIQPRSKAEIAQESDLELWASCSSFEEYEERKKTLREKAETERKEFMDKAGYFPCFNSLPIDLRLKIWEAAMLEPTDVKITVSKYTAAPRNPNARCGTVGPASISEFRATATIPALILVNHEAHDAARKFYKVLFRNTQRRYGILAKFPTILRLDDGGLLKLLLRNNGDDLPFVETFVFTTTEHWKFIGNESLFVEAILKMENLGLLDIRIANMGVQRFMQPVPNLWAAPVLNLIRSGFARRQDNSPEWNAPAIRIIDLCSDKGNEVELYRYNGGRVTDMEDCYQNGIFLSL